MCLYRRAIVLSMFLFLIPWTLALVPLSSVFAETRAAKVAGAFYPADPAELRRVITSALASSPSPGAVPMTRILLQPHAGYPYSGPVAARGFSRLQGGFHYDAVVVVGFMHQEPFAGTSVDDRETYRTPLGDIPVDLEAVSFLHTQPTIHHREEAHESVEHSLEVMLPFLQVVLKEFRLVPLLMGNVSHADAEALAGALAKLSERGNYLFVFSTDLSHYHPYEEAVQLDERTVNAILFETSQAADRLFQAGVLEACGRGPILAAMALARRFGYLEPHLLAYANSGDTAGDNNRVVGYASLAWHDEWSQPWYQRPQDLIADDAGRTLVKASRAILEAHFKRGPPLDPSTFAAVPALAQARGMFVTLRRKTGELRGCIGRIETDVPMAALLPTVTLEAALHDARFSPLTAEELDDVTVEVSILSHPKPVTHPRDIVAGRDGVVLQQDGRSGVLLPQVWEETGWTRVEFLRELAHQKAGLDPDAWQDAKLSIFQDQTFEEE